MRKILVPIACFEGSQAILRLAARVAEALQAGLTVLHVTPSPSGGLLGGRLASDKLAEWGIELPQFKLLQQVQEAFREWEFLSLDPLGRPVEKHTLKLLAHGLYEVHLIGGRGQDVRLRLKEGEAVTEILHEAEDPSYDLIIVGTRGHRGLKRLLAGSVAYEVARNTPCSILIAKNLRLELDQGLLVGVSGLPTALEAVRQAAELAQALKVKLTLLAVARQASERPQAEDHLQEAFNLIPTGLQVQSRLLVGDPARLLIEEAGEDNVLVLGRAEPSKVKQLLLGDVALRALDQSLGPVLLTRSPRP